MVVILLQVSDRNFQIHAVTFEAHTADQAGNSVDPGLARSEEGLEQSCNSLDAQRVEAYTERRLPPDFSNSPPTGRNLSRQKSKLASKTSVGLAQPGLKMYVVKLNFL